jgi:hypothetical protein
VCGAAARAGCSTAARTPRQWTEDEETSVQPEEGIPERIAVVDEGRIIARAEGQNQDCVLTQLSSPFSGSIFRQLPLPSSTLHSQRH